MVNVGGVDDEDYHLKQYSWYPSKGAVYGHIGTKTVIMHRIIMGYTGELVIDHIDRNPLNNRKCNLRIVTRCQNNQNKSSVIGYFDTGVGWDDNYRKWSV